MSNWLRSIHSVLFRKSDVFKQNVSTWGESQRSPEDTWQQRLALDTTSAESRRGLIDRLSSAVDLQEVLDAATMSGLDDLRPCRGCSSPHESETAAYLCSLLCGMDDEISSWAWKRMTNQAGESRVSNELGRSRVVMDFITSVERELNAPN